MIAKKTTQRSLLARLDALEANTLVTLYIKSGVAFRGYISGVGTGELIDLYEQSALIAESRALVIDGCDVVAFKVEVPQ